MYSSLVGFAALLVQGKASIRKLTAMCATLVVQIAQLLTVSREREIEQGISLRQARKTEK